MRKLKILSAVLVLLIVMTSFSGCFSLVGKVVSGQKTVDLKDYIIVSFGEYEGYSDPTFDIDYDGIAATFDIEKFNKYKEKLPENVQFEITYISSYAHFFSYSFRENYENVSNGDKIYIDVTLDPMFSDLGITLDEFCKKCGIKFKDTELQYKVSGLKELDNAVDIMFPEIEQYIEYEGANGSGMPGSPKIPDDFMKQSGNLYFVKGDSYSNSIDVILNNTQVATIIYNFRYHEFSDKKLTGGDEIVLYAEVSEKNGYTSENGFITADNQVIFCDASKTITVPDLGEYVKSREQLTPDVIEKIKALAEEKDTEGIYDIYFAVTKPHKTTNYDCAEFVVLITTESSFFGGTEYFVDTVHDIIIKPDGRVTAKYNEESGFGADSLEEAVADLDYDSYEFTKIS
ncbi:MAG: hypothetical protein IJA39_01270 [Clostridia bacterium]|nr:hypothetical protein [Clostridia bacterium]